MNQYLLFELTLHAIYVNTLAYLEDVLGIRCIYDKYFAWLWNKHTAEDGCYDKYDWNVEDYNACSVVSKDVRYRLRSEYEEPIACFFISKYVLHGVYKALLISYIGVTRTQVPVRDVVNFFILSLVPITEKLELVTNVERLVSR